MSARRVVLGALLALAFAGCASTPEPVAPVEAPIDPSTLKRLVVQPVRVVAGKEGLALELEAELCAAASRSKRHTVICPQDLRAASEALGSMSALGQCDDPEAGCESNLERMATGELFLNASYDVKSDDSAVVVVRLLGADGGIVQQAERRALVTHELHKEVDPAVRLVLGL